jgi:multidrug resistance efflux pump
MNNPNTHPAPAMVYGGAPSFDDAPDPFTVIADLRAGLDVAKRLREHLPSDAPELQQADDTIAAMEAALDAADVVPTPDPGGMIVAYHAAIDELATLRADNDARGEMIEQLRAGLANADRRNEALAAELDAVRSERDAAWAELTKAEHTIGTMAVRLDIANADFERQQRLTALFVRVLREMTPGAE